MIAVLCQKYDVLCIADEVYEWLFYPGSRHIKIGNTKVLLSYINENYCCFN